MSVGVLETAEALPAPLSAYAGLLARLRHGPPVDDAASTLVDEAAEVWSRPGFDTFLSTTAVRFTPFGYQLQAAQVALRRMRGRCILADEVGLGKTIEAGLALSELRLRGLAGRTLVVAPAGLVAQWQEELERKFGLPTTVARRTGWDDRPDRPIVLASLAAARREPLKAALTAEPWDALVVDEAHRVRNPRNASGQLVRALRSRYLLLLTATPVENRLQDLYEMISLVAPGLLGTAAQFRARHSARGGGADQAPRNVDELRAGTRQVMIRHRRSEVALMLPQRLAETVPVTPSAEEAAFYADLTARIRTAGRSATPGRLMALRSLAKLAGSSPAAAAATLAKVGWADLAGRARAIKRPEKAAVLVDRVRRHVARGEKVLVFTAYRQTLDLLADEVAAAGVDAAVYHGGPPRAAKDAVIGEFRAAVPVMLSTESAGEGRNLQFCHVMVNVDLPWNPMQIEQRVGRLHRVGQQHDVLVTNLVAHGTIEQRVLRVLEAKINLFELVVGELDLILGRLDDELDLESAIFDAYLRADDDAEFVARLESLGDDLARARAEYLRSRSATDSFVGELGEPGEPGRPGGLGERGRPGERGRVAGSSR